jgi:hypothetical protein
MDPSKRHPPRRPNPAAQVVWFRCVPRFAAVRTCCEQQAKRATSLDPSALCTAKQAPSTFFDTSGYNSCAIPHLLFSFPPPATRGAVKGEERSFPHRRLGSDTMKKEECAAADKTLKPNYRSARIGADLLIHINTCLSVLPVCTALRTARSIGPLDACPSSPAPY